MGEVYGVFAVAAALFALIAWLESRKPDPGGLIVLAILGALFMGTFAWTAWNDHQECKENPAYRAIHPDDC